MYRLRIVHSSTVGVSIIIYSKGVRMTCSACLRPIIHCYIQTTSHPSRGLWSSFLPLALTKIMSVDRLPVMNNGRPGHFLPGLWYWWREARVVDYVQFSDSSCFHELR